MNSGALIALLIGLGFVALLVLWWRSSGTKPPPARTPGELSEPLLRRTPRPLKDIIYNPKGYRRPRK